MPYGGGRDGGDPAIGGENDCPTCAGEAGDDVRVAGAVDVANLVGARTLIPLREGDGAERARGVGELE